MLARSFVNGVRLSNSKVFASSSWITSLYSRQRLENFSHGAATWKNPAVLTNGALQQLNGFSSRCFSHAAVPSKKRPSKHILNELQESCHSGTTQDLAQAYFPDRKTTSGLGAVFQPKSVAVVGATDRAGSVGRTIVNNLITGNKLGNHQYELYPVNPTRKTVLGLPCFKSLEEIPHSVDMAILVTPAASCVDVMRQCAKKGVGAAVVISAGFKEAGPEGIKLENELVRTARDAGIRIIGPNCIGVMNPSFGLNATFAATMGLPGSLAFISQSGAMCTSVLDWSLKEGIGFSAFVSVGGMADVNWGDLIDYLGNDPNTSAILMYMEGAGDARSLLAACKEAALKKPIIVIKAGKSEQAAAAAASHTGSLAGSHKSFEAAMQRVGVMTVDTIHDLFNCALVLGKQPRPAGPNLMIMTNAGGPAVLATDAAVTSGAAIAKLSEESKHKLNEFLPSAWSHSNPVDILGDASPALFAKSLEVVLKDKEADGVLVILSPQDVTDPTSTAKELVAATEKLKASGWTPKPILAAWMGGESVELGARILSQAGIPAFSNPDDAASTFGRLWKQAESLDTLYDTPSNVASSSLSATDGVSRKNDCINILQKVSAENRSLLTEAESKQILSAYGIGVVPTVVALTAEEAKQAARSMGKKLYAIKLNSKTLTHKADVGGVKLNLPADKVEQAFEEIKQAVVSAHGIDHFQGVTVQPMIELDKGIELILGSTIDAQFGPLIMFGSGGTSVEIYKDTALGIPPLNDNLAEVLMKQTRVFKALQGAQGKRYEGVDLGILQDVMTKFSTMIVDLADYISECDINPLLARKDEFIALDARIALTQKPHESTALSIRPYPSEYIRTLTLNNNVEVLLRPTVSGDKVQLSKFFESLPTDKAKSRFLTDISPEDRFPLEKKISLCYADYNRLLPLIAVESATGDIMGVCELEHPPKNHLNSTIGYVRVALVNKAEALGLNDVLLENVIQVAKQENLQELKILCLQTDSKLIDSIRKLGWEHESLLTNSAENASLYSLQL